KTFKIMSKKFWYFVKKLINIIWIRHVEFNITLECLILY
ncbi:unnamed protein product, partial [marine sediment metagenome]